MSTTPNLIVPDRPDYQPPIPLREAIDAGLDVSVMDADTVGMILASESYRQRTPGRHLVRWTLEGIVQNDSGQVLFPPIAHENGDWEACWPSQAMLDAYQWEADLADDPDLGPFVLERFSDEQRDIVRHHVEDGEQRDTAREAVEQATDDEIVDAARALAIWALTSADQPGGEPLRYLGKQMAEAAQDRAVRELRQFFTDPELFR